MKNSTKKFDKIGPNYKVAKEQFPLINKKFYDEYLDGYILIKVTDLVDKLTNPKKYINYIKDKKFKLGELQFNSPTLNENDIINFAKIELMDLYYHGLESFIRLFLAHASLKECPWLEMTKLSMDSYKSAITKLANDDFDWINNKLNGDITVLYTFMGYSELPEGITQEDLKGFRLWVSWIAKELLDHKEYNSYKHGLALFSKQENFGIKNDESSFLSFNGDSIHTLQVEKKSDRHVWVQSAKFVKYDIYCTILTIVSNLIDSIILIGKYHYIGAEYKINWLPNKDCNPTMILSKSNSSDKSIIQELGCTVKYLKQELLYYK